MWREAVPAQLVAAVTVPVLAGGWNLLLVHNCLSSGLSRIAVGKRISRGCIPLKMCSVQELASLSLSDTRRLPLSCCEGQAGESVGQPLELCRVRRQHLWSPSLLSPS